MVFVFECTLKKKKPRLDNELYHRKKTVFICRTSPQRWQVVSDVPQRETAADSQFQLAVDFVVKGREERLRNRSTSWSPGTPVVRLEKDSEWRERDGGGGGVTTPSLHKKAFFHQTKTHQVWHR